MSIVDDLRRDGIVQIDRLFDVAPFVDYLSKRPVYRNHVRQGKPEEGPLGSWPWMCHDIGDVIQAPGWLETAIDLAPMAAAYLNKPPLLFSLNVFYTEPGVAPKGDIQEFHRDKDDDDFLALFVYCVDILSEDDGPHQFMVGTHAGQGSGECRSIYGPAGTMFLAATTGLHKGLVPKRGRRMVAWARWGISEAPWAYVWDGLRPISRELIGDRYPKDPVVQNEIKLVVK